MVRPDPTLRNRMEVWGNPFPVEHIRRTRACVPSFSLPFRSLCHRDHFVFETSKSINERKFEKDTRKLRDDGVFRRLKYMILERKYFRGFEFDDDPGECI